MKARELDRLFDQGADITEYLEIEHSRRPGHKHRRVNVDFPVWMIALLDREASRVGVTRQSVIKMWLAERLQSEKQSKSANVETPSPPGAERKKSMRA